MTGPEHYRHAEEHLEVAEVAGFGTDDERWHLQAAQVHAALALAAATALGASGIPASGPTAQEWRTVIVTAKPVSTDD